MWCNTQEDHDCNLEHFLKVAKKDCLTFNNDKCVYSTTSIDLLGYRISDGSLKPDPECLRSLLDLLAPNTLKSLQRVSGMFAYYEKWISHFSDKIRPLLNVTSFPLNQEQSDAFDTLKQDLANVSILAINESLPFTVETDASDFAIAATLNQGGRPVAFHSRTFQGSEKHHSAVEKRQKLLLNPLNTGAIIC